MSESSPPAAVFFDGRSSRRRAVELRFDASLAILEDGSCIASWPYAGIRLADSPPGTMRLNCLSAAPLARLELHDAAARAGIERHCSALTGAGGAQAISVGRIAAWSLAAAAAIVAVIWFGVPVAADQMAEVLPASWEKPLGEAVDKQIRALFPGKPCTRPEGRAALARLVESLQSAARLRIPADPVVLQSPVPNAFALPGGRVYVLSGLLDRARSPDELAGVLAHEFGHISHRDGIRRIIRDGGTGFLVGLLFGDVTGAGAALFAARSWLSAAYSREIEADADGFAIEVMHRLGRPTAPFGDLLLRIAQPGEEAFSILEDHPLTPERVERLDEASSVPAGPALLDAAEWQALKAVCR
jgi:Zn-dependent protease with chaperone function